MDGATGRNFYGNSLLKRLRSNGSSEWGSKMSKRIKTNQGYGYTPTASSPTSWRFEAGQKRNYACSELSGCSDPVFFKLTHEFDSGRYGSVSKEIEELIVRRRQIMDVIYARNPKLPFTCSVVPTYVPPEVIDLDLDDEPDGTSFVLRKVIPAVQNVNSSGPVVIDLDDDDDDDDATKSENKTCQYLGSNLPMPSVPNILPSARGILSMRACLEQNFSQVQSTGRVDAWNAGGKENNTGGIGDEYNDEGKQDAYSVEVKDSVEENNTGGIGDEYNDEGKQDAYSVEVKDSVEENNTGGIGDEYNDEGKQDAYSVEVKDDAYDAGGIMEDKGEYVGTDEEESDELSDTNLDDGLDAGGIMEDKGEYIGTDEEESDELSDTNPDDGLGNIWNQMAVAIEYSKDATDDEPEAEYEEDCEHIFILKDDLGDVCRICGVVKRGIESKIEYNFSKNTRSTRTYKYEGRTPGELDLSDVLPDNFKPSGDFTAADINPHPRHRKEMKPHQIEGFNFLLSNLVTDNPGGCIMAHAPGSGKTFMIISFLQSFMAKYPAARPLVILPKGILSIWKKEFARWQVEDLPLLDFYSVKADSRERQLEVLKRWEQERSVLFLGYMQFSSIICDTDSGPIASACQNYLLKIPTILILDEGHTPRNQDTEILTSLERVETARKVVLSGTLYQNHVREVFNILNLVRPKFLKLDNPKVIKKRILSMVEISGRRNFKDNEFYELIEQALTKDENFTRKENVIRELREMTKSVLHYYKGDNLDELPGLVDFSVFLRLKPPQKAEVKQLRLLNRKFAISAQGSAIYVHPKLKTLSKNTGVKDRVDEEKIDAILEKFDVREGVKANFYLNLLRMCVSSGEKMLVFSQYLLPLKFLERLTAKVKRYSLGREMFMITGDSDAEMRETSMEKFNNSPDARVFFGSIKACGEGISLVGASRIVILDVPLNPSVTRQAIGRAFRPGQVRKVYTYRLIASETPEQDDHNVCFRKESIAKMWFEWDSFSGNRKFEMDSVEANECGDDFLETGRLNEDIVSVLKR